MIVLQNRLKKPRCNTFEVADPWQPLPEGQLVLMSHPGPHIHTKLGVTSSALSARCCGYFLLYQIFTKSSDSIVLEIIEPINTLFSSSLLKLILLDNSSYPPYKHNMAV